MKWLEIIEVRIKEGKSKVFEQLLNQLEKEENRNMKIVRIFRHCNISTDYSFHLYHQSDRLDRDGSQLGLNLAAAFREMGIVHYNTWVELTDKKEQT